MMERVLVGLSGGVDSSVVVARLRDEGFQPVAATLVMQHGAWSVPLSWSTPVGGRPTPASFATLP